MHGPLEWGTKKGSEWNTHLISSTNHLPTSYNVSANHIHMDIH